jgi:hypothetical protein
MTCKLKLCEKKVKAQGYCPTHYHRHIFMKKRPLWHIYQNMIRRCHELNHPRYQDWGGRGIKVCERWRNNYFDFEADMGQRPSPFHQIDRINNNKGYSPDNCRWVTAVINSSFGRRRPKSNNTSGAIGVCYSISAKRWQATITVHKKRHHLGWFKSKFQAIEARKLAEVYYANSVTL